MSTALRIASVTHVLKDLLNNGLIDNDLTGPLGNVRVTSMPPDKLESVDESQLNLFMYHVSYNQGWRNVALPAFSSGGERTSNPPLALDLHYFLTAYGAEELHSEVLLGYGMQLLHENMVLDRTAIRKSIGPPSTLSGKNLPESLKLLSTSDLAEQAEQIKITPETLSIEDLSKLWAAFGGKYRPSAAYLVTVVLIESTKKIKPGLPVRERNIYVTPTKSPVIQKVLSQTAIGMPIVDNQKILSDYRLVLSGHKLFNENVEIAIDGVVVPPVAAAITIEDTAVGFNLPASLTAGLHQVQISHLMPMSTPPELRKTESSNAAMFYLSPQITDVPIVLDLIAVGDEPRSATIAIKVDPRIDRKQNVILILTQVAAEGKTFLFKWSPPPPVEPPVLFDQLSIAVHGLKPGSYLVGLNVDGAESPMKAEGVEIIIQLP